MFRKHSFVWFLKCCHNVLRKSFIKHQEDISDHADHVLEMLFSNVLTTLTLNVLGEMFSKHFAKMLP